MNLGRNVVVVFVVVVLVGMIATFIQSCIGCRKERFSPLNHPSKCYSCEQWKNGWQGMKAKSFSAERHAAEMGDGFFGKTLRYY